MYACPSLAAAAAAAAAAGPDGPVRGPSVGEFAIMHMQYDTT